MFFFIPIGHEDSQIRRFPLSSAVILFACLAAFAQTWPRFQKEAEEAMEALSGVMRELAALAHGESDDADSFAETMDAVYQARDPQSFLETAEKAIREHEEKHRDREALEPLKEEVRRARSLIENTVFHRHGLVPASPRILAFLTHMFLHGGYLHLISNFIFFLLVGPTLEDLWGRAAFLAVYLLSGLAAAVGYMLVTGSSPVPMVGASGAIAGLTGAFLFTFTHTRIKMLGFLWVFYFARVFTFTMPTWVFLPIWIGWEIVQGISQLGSMGNGDNVAHWAHIAGFFFGAAVPFVFRWTGLDKKIYPLFMTNEKGQQVRVSDSKLNFQIDPLYRKGLRLREGGDYRGSAATFQSLIDAYPDVLGPRLELAETYRVDGEDQKRRETLLEAMTVAASGKDPRIVEVYEVLRIDFPRAKLPPESLFKVGLAYQRAGRHVDALECLRKFTTQHPDHPLWVQAAVHLSDIFAGQMNDQKEALNLLLKARDLAKEGVWRQEVERRLKQPAAAEPRSPQKARP